MLRLLLNSHYQAVKAAGAATNSSAAFYLETLPDDEWYFYCKADRMDVAMEIATMFGKTKESIQNLPNARMIF